MDNILLFLIAFVVSFIGRYALYLVSKKRKPKKRKIENSIALEMKYLITKFGLDEKRIDNKGFAALISLLDGLIISATVVLVVTLTDNITLELFAGLVAALILITVVYEIVGRILVKKGYDKNGL